MRFSPVFAALAATAFAGLLTTGCNDPGIGRTCVPGITAANQVALNSPALDCPDRLCYVSTGSTPAMGLTRNVCTATCETDSDCGGANTVNSPDDSPANTMSLCPSTAGFVCAVVTVSGSFCCQKYCVCKNDLVLDYNVDANGATMTPPACMPGSGNTACMNI